MTDSNDTNEKAASPKFIEELPFAEDARINALMILQRRIFQLQADGLQKILQTRKEAEPVDLTDKFGMPPILMRRNKSDDVSNQNRMLDDVEMTLLGILDSTGILSLSSRISEFIVVMTRIIKVEHRALCLHILSNCISTKCGQSFIAFGGLRLLKRWIKVAEEEDCVDELTVIVTLCKKLPFDGEALKVTEIGKSIKKLLKFRSSSTNLELLHTAVRSLMQHWTENYTNHIKGVVVTSSSPLSMESSAIDPDIVKAISDRMLEERGQPPPPIVITLPDIISKPTSPVIVKVISPLIVSNHQDKSNDSKIQLNSLAQTNMKSSLEGELSLKKKVPSSSSFSSEIPHKHTAVQIQQAPSAPSSSAGKANINYSIPAALSSSGFSLIGQTFGGLGGLDVRPAPAPTKRMSSDGANVMAEKAKLQLQNKLKTASMDSADPGSSSSTKIVSTITPVGVLKGGLKRKYVETPDSSIDPSTTVNNEGKRAKMTVMWLDEHGGSLRDTMTFEVEKIKNTLKDYKSHRDLVRRERQLEKDLYLSRVKEVMHPAVEWKRPDPLLLSIDISDNLEAHVTSRELEIQTKRLAHVLETRYVDDTLIPGDPDMASDALGNAVPTDDISPTITIIWELPGESPSTSLPLVSESVGIEEMQNIGNVGVGSDSVGFLQIIAALPPSLRNLDRHFLQLLVQDEANVTFILNNEGEVDQGRLELLRLKLMPEMQSSGRDRDDRGQFYDPYPPQGFNGFPPPQFRGGGPEGSSGSLPPPNFRDHMDPSLHGGSESNMSMQGNQREYNPSDMVGNDRQQNNGPGARKRSRFSGRDDAHMGGQDQSQFQENIQPMHHYRDQGGPDQGSYGLDNMHQNHQQFDERQHFDQNQQQQQQQQQQDIYDDNSGGSDQRRREDAAMQQKKFPTTKAAASCRFFNTRKGCQFGDKCPFGHFIVELPPPGARSRDHPPPGPGPGPPSHSPGNGRDNYYSARGDRKDGVGSRHSPGGKQSGRGNRR